uniref:BPTI/Kunitz inhibitor domain-containing protein n=1 Tax=Podarcis muralis TaxID=64176 RepID=A0A670KEG2_PODMU
FIILVPLFSSVTLQFVNLILNIWLSEVDTALTFFTQPNAEPLNYRSCRDSIPRFFFNTETKMCEQFIFGGCEPNANNFLKYASCYQECGRFGKNKEQFIFGGCEPNANNFLKYASCYQECGRFAGIPRICKIAKSHGSCRGNYPRYFFNVETLQCEKFIYSGCGGTENNFVSLTDCTHGCESYGKRNFFLKKPHFRHLKVRVDKYVPLQLKGKRRFRALLWFARSGLVMLAT